MSEYVKLSVGGVIFVTSRIALSEGLDALLTIIRRRPDVWCFDKIFDRVYFLALPER